MQRRRTRWYFCQHLVVIAAATLLTTAMARAADPQSYSVTIGPSGNRALDTALKSSSELESLRGKGPISPFALTGRAQQDVNRLETVLHGFGYYDGKVVITLEGRPLDDPDLPAVVEALPKETNARADITVETGPLYHLRRVTIEGELPDEVRGRVGIKGGDPAVAADVLQAQARLLSALQEDGYAFAKVDTPIAFEDPATQVLDVTYKVQAGPRVDVGDIDVSGLHEVHEALVRERLLLHTGERYSPSKIEKARQDLLSLGVFSGITVRAGEKLDPLGRIPISFDVQERPRHAVAFTGAYSTDLGASVTATWSNRNLFGNAEQLNLAAAVSGLGGRATTGVGYNVSSQFIKPEFRARDQSLQLNAGALRQKLEAYDQDAVTAGVSVNRKFTEVWSGSIGVSAIRERILQEGVTNDYTLLGIPVSAKYNSTGVTNPLEDTRHGIRAAATVTPTHSFGSDGATFVIIQTNASGYFDLASVASTAPGRTVLAWRALIGSVQGATTFQVPPDQRFYGGGSATVRGFRYQSIGPQFPDGKPVGGLSIDAATIEFRQRLPNSFGVAAFIDAGQVGETSTPFQGTVHVGAGLGVRYYTAIGPIRLDVAVPLNKPRGGDSFELYIGLGQAF